MSKPIYAIRQIKCIGCGKIVKDRMSSNRQYCSLECYRNGNRPNRLSGAYKNCLNCNKKIYVPKHRLKERNFCNLDCLNTFQGRNKIKLKCKYCGKNFRRSPCFRCQLYCSEKCRIKCPEWKENVVVATTAALFNNFNPNKLEIKGREILCCLGVPFKEQVLINNKIRVDVLLPSNIIIQWDGDYWHGYNRKNLDKRQRKRISFDKSQNAYLKKCGYTVLRFWEHDVNDKPEYVYENIRKTVQKIAIRLTKTL